MLDLAKRRRLREPHKLPAGFYSGVVVDVHWAEGYDDPEAAYEVVYEITGDDGYTYRHREVFKNNEKSTRTADFENYLDDHGIADLADFVGKREKLEFDYITYYGKEYFSIVDRDFIDEE